MSHSCTSISTRLSSSTCILQLQSSPSPYHSGQFGERITPPGPVRSPPHCAAGDVTKEKVWFHLFLFFGISVNGHFFKIPTWRTTLFLFCSFILRDNIIFTRRLLLLALSSVLLSCSCLFFQTLNRSIFSSASGLFITLSRCWSNSSGCCCRGVTFITPG